MRLLSWIYRYNYTKTMKKIKFKKLTKILLWTNWLILTAVAMLAPIYAIFVDKIWWNLMDASIAGWIFALSAGITSLISWKITDNLKKKILKKYFWLNKILIYS